MNEQLQYQIYKRFDILERIGSGTYGVVFKVLDRRTNQVGALKKICDAFQNRTDSQRTYREILYLSEVSHPNVVRLLDVIEAKNQRDVYLLFEFMEFDLAAVLKLAPLEPLQRKHIAWQLLSALECLHSLGVVHRDVKPSNILIDRQCNVRLCDFGLTRGLATGREKEEVLTQYIAGRSYRAPQVILSVGSYGFGVDLWSVGCVMAELLLRRPIFYGESTLDQLEKILSVVGMPRKAEIDALNSSDPRQLLSNFSIVKKTPVSEILFDAGDQELDLLISLLQFIPNKRISARDALRHPYFEQLIELQCHSYSHTDGSLTRKNHVIEKSGPNQDYRLLVHELADSYREFDRTSNFTSCYDGRRESQCRSDPAFKDLHTENHMRTHISRSTLQVNNTSAILTSKSTQNYRPSLKQRSRLSHTKLNSSTNQSKAKLHPKHEDGLRRSSKTKHEKSSVSQPRQRDKDRTSSSILKTTKTMSTISVIKEREPLKMRKVLGKKPVVASQKLIGQRKQLS